MYNYIHQNIIDTISRIEKNFPVYNLTYRNLKIWPVIKADFNFQLITNNSDDILKLVPPKKNWKQKIGDIASAYRTYKKTKKTFQEKFINDTAVSEIPENATYIFITFSTYRTNTINKVYYDSQYDSFLSSVKKTTDFCALEFDLGKETNKPSLSAAHNLSILKAKADLNNKKRKIWKYIFALANFKYNSIGEKTEEEFISFLKKENISCVYNSNYFEEQIDWILNLKNELKKIYRKKKPKYVICPSYFNHESFASILACHELGIKTIEVQHGIYGQPIYCFYGNTPKEGYELLPNYFLSWDASQANFINNWATHTSKHKAFDYGINALCFWAKNKVSFENIYLINLQELLAQKEKNKILFTISDTIDEKLPELIKNTQNNCYWFIRNHPRSANASFIIEFLNRMKELNCTNFELENSTHAPLYAILWKMDYHVTMISSVVCEALQLGLPSIVINKSGKQIYHDFYPNHPLVIFTENAVEIEKIITTKETSKKELKIRENQTFEDFMQNIESKETNYSL